VKLESKLKAIIKIIHSGHMDKHTSGEEATQLFCKKSSHRVSKYMGAPVKPECWGHQERFEDNFCVWHCSGGCSALSEKVISQVGCDSCDKGH